MKALVADASVMVDLMLGNIRESVLARVLKDPEYDLHIPALCDVEILEAMRVELVSGRVGPHYALEVLDIYRQLPLTRHEHIGLMPRALGLRHNFTAYDAMYVALAELLEAQFLTADQSLARAVAAHTHVRVAQLSY
ncbi:MAG: type II toxin-antitoxin system VapC family toxin [Gemmatimonadota bacterium]